MTTIAIAIAVAAAADHRPETRTLKHMLRVLVLAALLAISGAKAWAANVSITSIQPVAAEATLSSAVVQFNRDSSSGNLVVYFTLSGAATTHNSATLPTYTITSSATLALPAYATAGTVTIADGNTFAQLVITPLDNSAITGDLPLVVKVALDPNNIYNVVQTASSAQVDIAEGDYQASVVVPAPVAYEDTSKVGTADDPAAPRRGILRVSFSPITTFPGSVSAPGLAQLYLAPTTGAVPTNGTAIAIAPTATGGTFNATASATFGTGGSSYLSFAPGITAGIPIGSTVSTAGGFNGTVSLNPLFATPLYDKALKVQFGGTATLPSAATNASNGSGTDQYYVTYKIGGSALGSVTNTTSNSMGWNVVAYPGSPTVHTVTAVNLGIGASLPVGTQVYFAGNNAHVYTLASAYAGAPGPLQLTTGLIAPVHDGDVVTPIGVVSYIGQVSAPVVPGTTALIIENGVGTFALGDVFTLAGENANLCRYVILSATPDPVLSTDQDITFRRYTVGTVGFNGVNNLHSALTPGTTPSPALRTALNVSDDPPYNSNLNLNSTGGIVQLLIPAESTQVDFGINPIDNGLNDARLSVTMALFDDLNYAAITPTAGQVIIAGADCTASILAAANAVQGATQTTSTTGTFQITLTRPFSQAMTVPFTIIGSGAGVGQPGIDYTLSSASSLSVNGGIYSVVIPANTATATITVIPLITANLGTNGKTVTLSLSPTYDYLLAAASGSLNASATLSLLPLPPPVPQVSVAKGVDAQQPAIYNTTHTVGTFIISAQVAPVSNLTVQYALSGTAAPGTDYLLPANYSVVSGTGTATILAGTTSVTIAVDPNISPLPPYKAVDIAVLTVLPTGTYIIPSPAASSASLNIAQGQIKVIGVTSTPTSGTFHVGDTIAIAVTFSAPVAISGANPTLALNTGPTNAIATYVAPLGAPSAAVTFSYTVGAGDVNPHLDYLTSNALSGTIVDANLSATHVPLFVVSTALPAPGSAGSLFADSALDIDGTPAVALNVALHLNPTEVGPTAGYFVVTCTPAQPSALTVNYTLGGSAVTGVDIQPVGGTPGQLVIPSGQTVYHFPIAAIDNAAVLNPAETVSLTLLSGSGYHLGTPTTDTLTVAQDRVGVLGVAAQSPAGTYHLGDTITLALTFSAAVTVSGPATLALNSSASATATYASGSGTATLLFTYLVAVGDASSALDYTGSSALSGAFAPLDVTLPPVNNTLAAPGAAGSISAGATLVIDGAPAIAIDPTQHVQPSEVGLAPGHFTVTCTPPSPTSLTVTYTIGGSAVINTDIQPPPGTFTLATLTGQLTIPAHTANVALAITPIANPTLNLTETVVMTLAAGSGYHLAVAPAVTSDVLTVAQSSIGVIGVSAAPSSGTFHLGSQITITVTFSSAVLATGGPTLALNSGGSATYTSGSGTSTLSFTYVVGAGDSSAHLDYASPVALSGGSITDAGVSGLTVSPTLATPGAHGSLSASTSLVIDGSPPAVTQVSSTTANGTYTFGQSLDLTVTFSLPVSVSGTPELQLATGAIPAEATYAGGNGTSVLTFTYVVGANDASAKLDCSSANALFLNGGVITWAGPGAFDAALTLPVPGAAGSLGANKALVINGALPSGKPPVGSVTGPDAGAGGGCGLGSSAAALVAAFALCLRAALGRRRHRR